MLTDHKTRTAIFVLRDKGMGPRPIARSLGISRSTVKRLLHMGSSDVPIIMRAELAESHDATIRALFATCRGNLVRVHEELTAKGVVLPYSTLTKYCRRHGIGEEPKKPIGSFDFPPGEEMQHDTSPHTVLLGDRLRDVQCASVTLCFSRRLYAQVYPRWTRFWAKVFLTEALQWFPGAASRCMIDNSSVIVAHGNGKDAVMAPEMVAFGQRYGFVFKAHALGHADRSAYVERNFGYIERNFYPGRTFSDFADLNRQLREWCVQADQRTIRALSARPTDLFVTESTRLVPLPPHIPEPYLIHRRTVDLAGFIQLQRNYYSTPAALIDREVTVHESKDQVRIYDGHRLTCAHPRAEDGCIHRSLLEEHKRERERLRAKRPESVVRPREAAMRAASPVLAEMVAALKLRLGGRSTRSLDRLHRMWLDYPLAPLVDALRIALDYRLYDLDRIDALVIERIAGDYFRLPHSFDNDRSNPRHEDDCDPDAPEELL